MDTETRLISNRYIKKHNVTICKLSAIKDLPPYKKYKYGQINGKVNLENGCDISNLHSLDIYFTFKQFSYLLNLRELIMLKLTEDINRLTNGNNNR